MDAALFLQLAASTDKQGILALAQNGITLQKPEDLVKDTYTLEFLGIPEKSHYSEADLEQKIIGNLQTFLLELCQEIRHSTTSKEYDNNPKRTLRRKKEE